MSFGMYGGGFGSTGSLGSLVFMGIIALGVGGFMLWLIVNAAHWVEM